MNKESVFCQWLDSFRGKALSPSDVECLRLGIEKHYMNVYGTESEPVVIGPNPNHSPECLMEPTPVFETRTQKTNTIVETTIDEKMIPHLGSDVKTNTIDVSISPNEDASITIGVVEKVKKVIKNRIETIADILDMIDSYPLDESVEYNIDMAPLHRIRDELKELDEMIGLSSLKRSIVDQLLYFIQELHIVCGKKAGGDFKNIVLFGPPGTGKTEVARLIGRIYSKLGILKNSVFKKVVRSDLVAGYVGQTAIKTRGVIKDCLGGVLFIDEAYSLVTDDQFSSECIDTLCEALSDHKDELMVIVAGYEEQMKRVFFKSNPGLESRFIWRFKMPGYSAKELRGIFEKKVADAGWEAEGVTLGWFEDKQKHFVHFGRDMEMLFIYTKVAHSRRIYGLEKVNARPKWIIAKDLEEGFRMFTENSFHENECPGAISMMYV